MMLAIELIGRMLSSSSNWLSSSSLNVSCRIMY